VIDLMKSARRAGDDIIDLGMGNPDLPTPSHIVEKIAEASRNPRNHRYSASRGIPNLRAACAEWYQRNHGVEIDPDSEAIAVIGAKEGLSHFVLMTIGPGDVVLCPDPAYPIHQYSVIIAGGDLRHVPLTPDTDLIAEPRGGDRAHLAEAEDADHLVPAQSDHDVVDRGFFERIDRVREENDLMVLHDFAVRGGLLRRLQAAEHPRGAGREGRRDRDSCRSRRATRWRAGASASPRATAR
jgi:alanine-synthesizing transaminase